MTHRSLDVFSQVADTATEMRKRKTGGRLLVGLVVVASVVLVSCNQPDSPGNPTAPVVNCSFPSVPATAPEAGALAGITARHDYWRARVGVPALHWNSTLASMAQSYADQLNFAHDPNRQTGSGFSSVGENLYFSTDTTATGDVAVDAWAAERASYDFGTVIASGNLTTFGHYTQVVWSGTTDVGCGVASGAVIFNGTSTNGILYVCRYGPSGNYSGAAPYGYTAAPCVDLDNDNVFQKDDADDTDRTVQ